MASPQHQSSSSTPTRPSHQAKALKPSLHLDMKRCTKILNYLASYVECGPFTLPVPLDASIYHAAISRPMDLNTIERQLYGGHYKSEAQFLADLALVWKNAVSFNDKLNPIHKRAMALEHYYSTMDETIEKGRLDINCEPVELSTPADDSSNSGDRGFYMTMAILPDAAPATTKRLRGFSKIRPLYNELHGPLFESLDATTDFEAYPRLYISKNRSCFKEAIHSTNKTFTILWNSQFEQMSDDQVLLTTNVTLAKTFEHSFNDILPSTAGESAATLILSDLSPKAWVKVLPTNTYYNVKAVISKNIESAFFRRPWTTHRIHSASATGVEKEIMDRLVHCLSTGESDLRTIVKLEENQDEKEEKTKVDMVDVKKEDDTPMANDTVETAAPSPRTVIENEKYKSAMEKYRERTVDLFEDLKKYSKSKGVGVVNVQKYMVHTTSYANAEGFFKQVRYVENNDAIVVQTFRRMTTSQRAIELVSLLKLKGLPHMAEITEVLHAEDNANDVVGLAMRRYKSTLKQYTHSHTHHRLTAHQKMDLIRQMLQCLECIHANGIAHRDLSEVNFMVDEASTLLEDGSVAAHVYLIDFGKAVFTRPEDVRRWWIQPVPVKERQDTTATATTAASSGSVEDYEGEVIPEDEAELESWCDNLPHIQVKPDHGYRCYRSIQTLPRNRVDHAILPWLVDPVAEDMYSIGALIWKVFAETEPWHGILDTDLRGLREMVDDDDTIKTQVYREVAGDLSRQLLLLCLRTHPADRVTATALLEWLSTPSITAGLLKEWAQHAPTERKKRHAKAAFEFEEEQAAAAAQAKRDRKKQKKQAELKKKKEEAEAEKARVRMEKQRRKDEERRQEEQQRLMMQQQHAMQFRPYNHIPNKPPGFRPPLYAYPPHPPYVQFTQPGYHSYQPPQQQSYPLQYYYPPTHQPYPPPPPVTAAAPTQASSMSTFPVSNGIRPYLTRPSTIRIHEHNADQNPYLSRISRPTSNVRGGETQHIIPPPPPPPLLPNSTYRQRRKTNELSFVMMNPSRQDLP